MKQTAVRVDEKIKEKAVKIAKKKYGLQTFNAVVNWLLVKLVNKGE